MIHGVGGWTYIRWSLSVSEGNSIINLLFVLWRFSFFFVQLQTHQKKKLSKFLYIFVPFFVAGERCQTISSYFLLIHIYFHSFSYPNHCSLVVNGIGAFFYFYFSFFLLTFDSFFIWQTQQLTKNHREQRWETDQL